MNENHLFRIEAVQHKNHWQQGVLFINTPFNYLVMISGFSILAILIILFIFFAEFSEKLIVSGYLEYSQGLARIYPPKAGIMISSKVYQGMQVKKGDKLFFIDTSYEGLRSANQQALLVQLHKKEQAIKKAIHHRQHQLHLLKPLLDKKYISLSIYNQQQDALTELIASKNQVEMELIQYKQASSYSIRAPITGTMTSTLFKPGQQISPHKPLVTILPKNAQLEATLFIPVKQSGFLDKGSKVVLHYDAFPYERFGSYQAQINFFGETPLMDKDEDKLLKIGQPYYKATAQLASQQVSVYGDSKTLRQGMTFSAVIIGKKRKIWQWILDPLYSFYGDFT